MARILAVDDNEDNVFLLRMILENHNHEVLPAYNGKEALAIAEKTQIDLVLLDLMMPEMNGLEVAARLKSREATRHVPVILLTAKKKEVSDVVEALDSGADEYLTKPFHETELVARVKSMLRMKSLFDQIDNAKKLMEEDLEMAQYVQKTMLPTRFPYPDRIKVNAFYDATSSVGGDYYDTVDYGDGKLGLMIADVSGHGASAALIVSMIKTIVMSHTGPEVTPEELGLLLNRRLIEMIPAERYFTMFFGQIDLNRNKLTYISAGHPSSFLMRKADKSVVKLNARGLMLAMFDDIKLDQAEIDLQPGDRLMAYSDGLFEVQNETGDIFGTDRLKAELEAGFDMEGDELIQRLIQVTRDFSGGDAQDDDIAVLLTELIK